MGVRGPRSYCFCDPDGGADSGEEPALPFALRPLLVALYPSVSWPIGQLLHQASPRLTKPEPEATYLQVIQPVRLLASLIRVRLGGAALVLAID